MKLKKSSCDETPKLKFRWNSKTQIVMKLNLKCWQNSKIQSVTKFKNSNCDKTWKLKFWKTQIVNKLKLWEKNHNLKCDKTQIVTKLENSDYDKLKNSNWDITAKFKLCQKPKLWLNSNCDKKKNEILMKLKSSNGDKT